MNWDALGAIAEAIGAIGVVASLLYLAWQIRHNTSVTWSQNVHARTQQVLQIMALQVNPQLVEAIEKAYFTREPVTRPDYILLEAYLISATWNLRDDYLHYRKGLLSKDDWEQRKRDVEAYFDAEYAKEWWKLAVRRQFWEPDFAQEVDEIIARMRVGSVPLDVVTELSKRAP